MLSSDAPTSELLLHAERLAELELQIMWPHIVAGAHEKPTVASSIHGADP
jgi:hypothetical protein